MFLIKGDIGNCLNESLNHLICRTVVIKADKGDSVLNAIVVCIKGDKILNAVELELTKHHCAVERLTVGSLVLSSLIEHRHNNRNSARLTLNSTNNTLKISEMLIGGHRNCSTSHLIGDTVVKGVTDDHDVKTSDRLLKKSLCLTRTETRAIDLYKI